MTDAQYQALSDKDWDFLEKYGCYQGHCVSMGYGKTKIGMVDVGNQKLMVKRKLTKMGIPYESIAWG